VEGDETEQRSVTAARRSVIKVAQRSFPGWRAPSAGR
jgi:hypothetical protein